MVPSTYEVGAADDDRPLAMADIGRALGLSRQAVSKAAQAGMPVHSIEAAHSWRKANLDPTRRKRGAFDTELVTRAALARATALMELAGAALRSSPDVFTALVPTLRQALREVPEGGRDRMMLDYAVLDELCRPAREMLNHCEEQDLTEAKRAGIPNPEGPIRELTVEDADSMGAFWFSIAAGERVLIAGPNFRS